MQFGYIIGIAGYAMEALGAAVIILGAASASWRYSYRKMIQGGGQDYMEFRREMGRAMMVGLEFLVAGDIIRTVVVSHTLTDIATLAMVVLIRTVLVFTIHLELEGHWPWQSKP
jgi:uncharacterized membrane protein